MPNDPSPASQLPGQPAPEDLVPQRHEDDLIGQLGRNEGDSQTDSAMTGALAFIANLLIAVAKSFAALVTGSASLVAEAAHSWADTGNEVFLVVAQRRSHRP